MYNIVNPKSVHILEDKSREDIGNPGKKYFISLVDKCLICNTEKMTLNFSITGTKFQEFKASSYGI